RARLVFRVIAGIEMDNLYRARGQTYFAPRCVELTEVVADMPIRFWSWRIGPPELIVGLGPVGLACGHGARIEVGLIGQPDLFEIGFGGHYRPAACREVPVYFVHHVPWMLGRRPRRHALGSRGDQNPAVLGWR